MAYPNSLPKNNLELMTEGMTWWKDAIINNDDREGFKDFLIDAGTYFPSGSSFSRATFYTWVRDYLPTPPTGNLYDYELPVLNGDWEVATIIAWGREKLFELNIFGDVTNGGSTASTPAITMSGRYGVNNWTRGTLVYMRYAFSQFPEYGGIYNGDGPQRMYSNSSLVAPTILPDTGNAGVPKQIDVINITNNSAQITVVDPEWAEPKRDEVERTTRLKKAGQGGYVILTTMHLTGLDQNSVYSVYREIFIDEGRSQRYIQSNIVDFVTNTSPHITPSITSKTLDSFAQTFTFSVSSNMTWAINDLTWASDSVGTVTGNKTVTITVSENTTGVERSGFLEFTTQFGEIKATIEVIQHAGVIVAPGTEVTPTSINKRASGGVSNIIIDNSSGQSWIINNPSPLSWVTISPRSGQGDEILQVVVEANISALPRFINIMLQVGSENFNIMVTQSGEI